MTITAALAAGSVQLQANSDQPELEASILLSSVLGQTREWLIIHALDTLAANSWTDFSHLITKRGRGQPVAYLTGQRDFFDVSLRVTPDVLIPRPATEAVVQAVLKLFPADQPLMVADIGTGSGAIALALARQRPHWRVIATDISPPAIEIAKKNAEQADVIHNLEFHQGSLLQPLGSMKIDVIVANLPYLRTEQMAEPSIQAEPVLALHGGIDGLDLIRDLIQQSQDFPQLQGLILEFQADQYTAVAELIAKNWPDCMIQPIFFAQTICGLTARFSR